MWPEVPKAIRSLSESSILLAGIPLAGADDSFAAMCRSMMSFVTMGVRNTVVSSSLEVECRTRELAFTLGLHTVSLSERQGS